MIFIFFYPPQKYHFTQHLQPLLNAYYVGVIKRNAISGDGQVTGRIDNLDM